MPPSLPYWPKVTNSLSVISFSTLLSEMLFHEILSALKKHAEIKASKVQ